MKLLQISSDFFAQPDFGNDWLIWVIGGIILLVIIVGSIAGRQSGSGSKFSGMAFRRKALSIGLTRDEIRLLLKIAKTPRVGRPMQLLSNPQYFESILRKLVREIDASEMPDSEREGRKHVLFRIGRLVDAAATPLRSISSTKAVRPGTEVRLSSEKGDSLETEIDGQLQEGFGVSVPFPGSGPPFGWKKGKRLQATLILNGDEVFSFSTKIINYVEAKGERSLVLEHVTNLQQIQKRRAPRREYSRPTYFYPVDVVSSGTGRKAAKRAVVNKKRRGLGRFVDVSGGGCAVQATTPLPKGTLVKLEFQGSSGGDISALGKVVGTQRTPPRGGLMHIMFTRMTRKNLNEIESYVFGAAEE